MEKPFLLILNVIASTALGMGVGSYVNGVFDFSLDDDVKPSQVAEKKQDKKAEVKLGASLGFSHEEDAITPISPTPTQKPAQAQPAVEVGANVGAQINANQGSDTNSLNGNGSQPAQVTPSPSPSATQAQASSPTTQPEQAKEEKLTPNRSAQGELHAKADVTLPNVAVGVLRNSLVKVGL